jgi:UDP-N-acetyl-D-glucosamine dehydrogenase
MKNFVYRNVVVLGQGYVGLPVSIAIAKAGYKVYGFDVDSNKIANLKLGVTSSPDVNRDDLNRLRINGDLIFTNEIPCLDEAAIYIITVPTPIKHDNSPELAMLESACKIIASVVDEGSIIINESTSFIGTLRNFIKPLIDDISNKLNLMYVVAPERIDPGNMNWNLSNTPRYVSGLTSNATEIAFNFYSEFCSDVSKAYKPEIAEAAKLFENTFRQVNIALVNEFSEITQSYGFSSHEAIDLSSTKPFGFMPFYSGLGVGGHCIPVDPHYLVYSAEHNGILSRIINVSNEINHLKPIKVAKRIQMEMKSNLSGKRIQLAGISYKVNISDIRESPALTLMAELKRMGAIVTWFDPLVDLELEGKSNNLDTDIDLGIIVTPHDNINFKAWLDKGTRVLDLSTTKKNYGWSKFF